MFCPKCGSEMPDVARFCSKCSAPLIDRAVDQKKTVSRRKLPVIAGFAAIVLVIIAASFMIMGGSSTDSKSSSTAVSEKISGETDNAAESSIGTENTGQASKTIETVVASGEYGLWAEDGRSKTVQKIQSTFSSDDDIFSLAEDYKSIVDYSAEMARKQEIESYFGTSTGILYRVSGNRFPHLSKSNGDRLLLTASSGSDLYANAYSSSTGFCQPSGVEADLGKYETIDGVNTSDYRKNGGAKEINAALDIFPLTSGGKIVLCSRESRELSAGWFEGSTYQEGKLSLTSPYVCIPSIAVSDTVKLEPEKMKDGYLVYDMANLQPGLYSIRVNGEKTNYVLYIDE